MDMKPLKGERPLDWSMRIDAMAELADMQLIKPQEIKSMKLCQGLNDEGLYDKITEMETQGWEKAKALIRKHTAATSLKADLEQKTCGQQHLGSREQGTWPFTRTKKKAQQIAERKKQNSTRKRRQKVPIPGERRQ